ncbi:MAG: hypothetical protein AAF715_20730 [Myxococcota bacterium]
MPEFRFEVGAPVMCNLGPSGWKLGRVIAHNYREDHWPIDRVAPYQVALEADRSLIYVPEDEDAYCRAATPEDTRMFYRMDALAALPPEGGAEHDGEAGAAGRRPAAGQLRRRGRVSPPGSARYRRGRCGCCHDDPRSWSSVELYSEHYRCAARNSLKVTRRTVNLGTVRVGDGVDHTAGHDEGSGGFGQCPTLTRLPPGLRFSDDGRLAGVVRFDPHREATYEVAFVAVSTAAWEDPNVGVVRLEVSFRVDGNAPPADFDADAFHRAQQRARTEAGRLLEDLVEAWRAWERGDADNRATIDRMRAALRDLRTLLEAHPRLDGGQWWGLLGGFHMNVHKLLENALFECELYLGHALTFGDANVRRAAEQNLEGCYQKRLLEAARFMWMDGAEQMMRGEWVVAAETLRLAAAKKDGWGWAVNHGEIWLAEAAARLVQGAELAAQHGVTDPESAHWVEVAAHLVERSLARTAEERFFDGGAHPWAAELVASLAAYRGLAGDGGAPVDWLEDFKLRTVYWCAQLLGGAPPFPPKVRPRRDDAAELRRRLPGHHP